MVSNRVAEPPNLQEQGIWGVRDVFTNLADGILPTDNKIVGGQYVNMLTLDGQARALYGALTTPIVSTPLQITPYDQRSLKEAEFVEKTLLSKSRDGGMLTPIKEVLATSARAVLEGFAPHELVWIYEPTDTKFYLKKIAFRSPHTVQAKVDEHGEFNGFDQKGFVNGKHIDVNIPKEKSLWFTIGKEFNNVYGRSSFDAAYYHYEKKHKLYYISHIAAQINATGLRKVLVPENATPTDEEKYLAAVAKLGFNSSIAMKHGWTLEIEDLGTPMSLLPYIQHHDSMMSKSVLAQFIDLGSETTIGSFKLSETQSDSFVDAVVTIMDKIMTVFNSQLVEKLIDYNFGSKKYPTVKYQPLSSYNLALLRDLYVGISKSRFVNVSTKMLMALEKIAAKRLGMDIEFVEEDYKHIETTRNAMKPEPRANETPKVGGD